MDETGEPKPTEPRADFFAGVRTLQEQALVRRLLAVFDRNPRALPEFVASLEAVVGLGYGDVTVGISSSRPVVIRTETSKSLTR